MMTRSMRREQEQANHRAPKNLIVMIVDGMGFEHVKAARIFNGMKPFSYEQFPCKTTVTTCSFAGADEQGNCIKDSADITDSAAAATAIATGIKVKNGAVSRRLPVEEADIETVLEMFKAQQKSTGIVATKLFSDATPAAFASHANYRSMTEEILQDMFQDTRPNVIFGADDAQHRQYARESKSSYQMVYTTKDMQSLAQKIGGGKNCEGGSCPHVYGGFGQYDMMPYSKPKHVGLPLEFASAEVFEKQGSPHLSQMTDAALTILNKNPDGFFLMVKARNPI